jgi:hypothetical protein
MKSKLLFSVLAAMLLTINAFSQNFNEKLLSRYSKAELMELKTGNPEQLELLDFFVSEGFHIINMPDKPIDYIELKKIDTNTGIINHDYMITDADLENFNPLEYNCMYHATEKRFYKAGNTGKLIVVPTSSSMVNRVENKQRINKTK